MFLKMSGELDINIVYNLTSQVGRAIGKLKPGSDWPARMLDELSQAAWLASLAGGVIEPLYRLHAARLRLAVALQGGGAPPGVDVALLAKYPFAEQPAASRTIKVCPFTLTLRDARPAVFAL